MVDPGEGLSLAAVGVGAGVDGSRQRPGVEADGGALVGEEDVVEVGEDRLESFPGPVTALLDEAFVGFLFGGAGTLLAFPGWGADGDRDAGAAGEDFDLSDRFASFVEAGGADPSGASGDDVDDECFVAGGADDVPYDVMDGLHVGNATSDVYAAIDLAVMRMGEVIHLQSERLSRRAFERWVREELPFDVWTARRVRAVYLAWSELPEPMLDGMPRPWEALFARSSISSM